MSSSTSKFLSYVLRHDPAKVGVVLDEAGWTDVPALLAALAAHGHPLTPAELVELVASSDKQRFALSPDGARIRANQGHSVDVQLDLSPLAPPAVLYHGTVAASLDSIRAQGLRKGARHHVHLSAEHETARKVGIRRGKPVVLRIRAAEMAAAGHTFYRSANGVWLTEHVPPAFLELPAPPRRSPSRDARIEIARSTLAACEAGHYVNAHEQRVYIADAIERAKRGTRLYELASYDAAATRTVGARRTRIAVTGESTIDALRRLAGSGHVACLSFASARNPGGGFLTGASAQEETLARSSGLYPCLLTVPEHYERNRAHRPAVYLDLAIWSPDVPFFRDDDGRWLDTPTPCSVITCAAPNAGALRQHGSFDPDVVEAALHRRAAFVLAIARDHGVDTLILGAWGSGAFGNDPAIVARVFRDHLEGAYADVFGEVVFAVLGGPGDRNHDVFAAAFAP